jgi:hypothetical protein
MAILRLEVIGWKMVERHPGVVGSLGRCKAGFGSGPRAEGRRAFRDGQQQPHKSTRAEASRDPSGLKATLKVHPPYPPSVRLSFPVAAFQSFTVPSSPPVASWVPSGL